MSDLILEFYSEEIPSRMQLKASRDLKVFFIDGISSSGLKYNKIDTFVTPRRLTLFIKNLSNSTPSYYEEKRGPRVGAPEKAIEGFIKSLNINKSSLYIQKEKKGEFYFYKSFHKGHSAKDIIIQITSDLIEKFPWKKSMRWGEGNLKWVRPLKFIYCSLFESNKKPQSVNFKFNEIMSVSYTIGHYLISDQKIFPKNIEDYINKLFANKVILDRSERKTIIIKSYEDLLKTEDSKVIYDDDLLEEIVGLVEWPVVFLGYIDEGFLSLPKEILQVTMKEHQKFLSVLNNKTNLIDKFIVVANMLAEDGGKAILEGNSRVLRSRLNDAKFFFEKDLKIIKSKGLLSFKEKLKNVTFHNKIGSQFDRINKIEKLSLKIAHLISADSIKCQKAANLCKNDLVSQVVTEFPELQGTVGKIYADLDGTDIDISNAIAEHYLPVKQDDKVPLNPISIVVSISDKINTLICFWKIKEKPTGSKDPFGLRRCAIGLIRTLIENKLKLDIRKLIFDYLNIDDLKDLFIFLEERFRVYLIERNYDHGVLDACLSYKDFNDPYLTFLKINAINNFKKDNNFKKLTYSYKRAINILNSEEKKNSIIFSKKPLSKLFEEKEEEILFKKITVVEKKVKKSLEKDDFYSALLSLSTIDNEIENFFEKVTINVDNQDVKFNRLNLCNKVRQNMHLVAYFSYINV